MPSISFNNALKYVNNVVPQNNYFGIVKCNNSSVTPISTTANSINVLFAGDGNDGNFVNNNSLSNNVTVLNRGDNLTNNATGHNNNCMNDKNEDECSPL